MIFYEFGRKKQFFIRFYHLRLLLAFFVVVLFYVSRDIRGYACPALDPAFHTVSSSNDSRIVLASCDPDCNCCIRM